ncbi:MAG: sugar-binding protein [Candidatus Atribacteria bacterium]|nr:sugar-binding protein [Candidatus Atribacteria bacterium]
MKKFLVIMLLVTLIMTLSVTATAQEKIKIGVLGKSVHPYWDVVRQGMEDAAKIFDVDATFYVPMTEDINKQIDTLEQWIAMGFDGISFAPSDPDAVIPVIKKAMEMGIPCITQDTDSPNSGRLLYMGTENYSAGVIAGEKMAEILGGKGKVAICTGSLTAMNSLERMRGFRDGIAGTEIEVIEPILCDYEDTSKAVELAETALMDHPDLAGFFGVYAFNGPAAGKAVQSAGKVGKVHVVCFDTTDEHLFMINDGVIDAAVGQRQYYMGYHSVTLLMLMKKIGVDNTLMLLPKTAEGDVIVDTGVDVVTKDNLADYVKQMDLWGVQHEFKL